MSKKPKVLILLDDELDIMELIYEKLTEKYTPDDLQCIYLEEELDAFKMSDKAAPDIMVFDQYLHGKDSSYLIKLFNPKIKKIIYSAFPSEKLPEKIPFIQKPDMDDLISKISEYLDQGASSEDM